MSLLIGMKEGEELDRLLEALPAGADRRTVARSKESFWRAAEQRFDAVLLHAELVADMYPWEWAARLRERQPYAKIVVFLCEEVYDSLWLEVVERLSTEAGFVATPVGCGMEERRGIALQTLLGEAPPADVSRTGVVAAVWSAACKDGATTVAANAALTLAREAPGLSVGLLDLNLKNPELRLLLGHADAGRSNASLRPKLQTGSLTTAELLAATAPFRRTPNLRLLCGTHRRDTAGDVSADMMGTLLAVCRRTFDVTVVDVSSYPDNAATVCAVRGADARWLVASNRPSSYLWSWGEWYECYWKHCGISPADAELVCNRYDPAGDPPEKAAAAIGMKLAAVLPNVPGGAGLRLSELGKPLADAPQAEPFAAEMYRLASRLHVLAGKAPLPERRSARRRYGFMSMISSLF
ncbi:hypothetical protein [Paenibacillus sp.]|uniref:AAA family ATPase n=1 Tax=Paenibacillus sp. TaxID=58172 RepID=UPI002D6BB21B|nr:hypothetical protein [Paenibacillus sp.]HZG86135.1 hypothetical protein [Paenibacillus sp.]